MNARPSTPTRRARAAYGFTLVELMVALTAGTITAGAAYLLSSNSTRNIGEQMRIGDTQMSLRAAIEQIRRDFSRAAYLGVPNASALLPAPTCPLPVSSVALNEPTSGNPMQSPVSGASVFVDGSLSGGLATGAAVQGLLNATSSPALAASQNLTRADLVMIQGAFAVGAMFPVDDTNPASVDDHVIQIDGDSVTFHMMFYDLPPGGGAGPGVLNAARFQSTFARGRALRFESDGRFYVRVIESSDGTVDPPIVRLLAAGPGLPEICGARSGAFVSVMSLMQYQLDPVDGGSDGAADTPADLSGLNHPTVPIADLSRTSKRAVLVRRELSYENQAQLAGSTAVILDNAVEFQVNAIHDQTPGGATPTFVRIDGTNAPTVEDISTTALTAGSLRSLIVTLSARSMEGDRLPMHRARTSLELPMFTFMVGNPNDPLDRSFFVSRVRTIRSEIFLPNMAVN